MLLAQAQAAQRRAAILPSMPRVSLPRAATQLPIILRRLLQAAPHPPALATPNIPVGPVQAAALQATRWRRGVICRNPANGNTATSATGAAAPTGGGAGGNGRSSSSGVGTAGSTPGGAAAALIEAVVQPPIPAAQVPTARWLTYYIAINGATTSINCGSGNPALNYGGSISCLATVAAISGSTSPTGTVAWTTNGEGSFITSPCTLSGTGGSAACSVTYTPSSVGTGSHLITASYSGDTNFLTSSGNQVVTVNKLAASVTATAASKTYGDSDPVSFTGSLAGFAGGR